MIWQKQLRALETHFKRFFLSLLFILGSCQTDDSHPVSRFEREIEYSKESPSPAIDPSTLPPEEQDLFSSLTPGGQTLFSSLSPMQRKWAIELTKPLPPDDAVWMAAEQEIKQLNLQTQDFYHGLNKRDKLLFLVLDDDPTKAALTYSETMSPEKAVREALKLEIDTYPNKLQKIINTLPTDKKILFLTFSDETLKHIFTLLETNSTDVALDKAIQMDVDRLSKEDQLFLQQLSPDAKAIFMILPPEDRWMAIALTKKLDFNLAMHYAASIQTEDNPQ